MSGLAVSHALTRQSNLLSETSSDAEVGGDGLEGLVDLPDILGLRVQRVIVNVFVVDTILLTTCNFSC
jgi:hypothetical protein